MTHSLFDGYWGRATTELANLGQKAELQSPRVHWVGQLQSSAMSTLPSLIPETLLSRADTDSTVTQWVTF